MGGESQTISAAEAASALRWWMEAGVDSAVQEGPRDWLRPAAAAASAAASRVVDAPLASESEPEPATLADFQAWLARSVPPAFAGAGAVRILPRGVEEAPIMLLADLPGAEDAAAGGPIGGDARLLADRMLAAIGVAADDAYVGSLACFHAPGARLGPAELADCAAIARRHVALARPKRLLLLGDGPAQALIGKPLAQARGHAHKVEGVRTVATFSPRHLLNRPADKALAWKDLLLLMEDEA